MVATGMVEETGQVIEVGEDYLKVSSQPKSACNGCDAQSGCGQGLLNRWGARSIVLRLSLDGRDPADFKPQDRVLVGVPEDALLRSVILLYATPLFTMIGGVLVGHWLFGGDLGVALLALAGLGAGALIARKSVQLITSYSSVTPVLLGKLEPA